MDYLSRIIEYSNLLHELEIGGEEHLEVILKDPSTYLKKAEEVQMKISSDQYLTAKDKEEMLREISSYIEKVRSKKKDDDLDLSSFGLGVLLGYVLKDGAALPAIMEELGRLFGGE
jgi:hypothetical protein